MKIVARSRNNLMQSRFMEK